MIRENTLREKETSEESSQEYFESEANEMMQETMKNLESSRNLIVKQKETPLKLGKKIQKHNRRKSNFFNELM
jgi:methionyl-tRNA formyltransferase